MDYTRTHTNSDSIIDATLVIPDCEKENVTCKYYKTCGVAGEFIAEEEYIGGTDPDNYFDS